MEEVHMGHLPKTLPEARDHPQYRPKQAMQQKRLAGSKANKDVTFVWIQ